MHHKREVDPCIKGVIKDLEQCTPVYAMAALSDSEVIYSFNGPSELLSEVVDKLKEHIVNQAN